MPSREVTGWVSACCARPALDATMIATQATNGRIGRGNWRLIRSMATSEWQRRGAVSFAKYRELVCQPRRRVTESIHGPARPGLSKDPPVGQLGMPAMLG